MCLESIHKKQAGAGLPIAIFIVTVLSLIVLGMSQLQESSGNAVSLQIQSQRAFFAAESGAQVVIAELVEEAGEQDIVSCPPSNNETQEVLDNFNAPGLSSCQAVVNITKECVGSEGIVTVKSEGSCGPSGSPERAVRTVEVRLR